MKPLAYVHPSCVAASRANAAAPQWQCAEVAQRLAAGGFRLGDGRAAAQALSCLLVPEAGDRVLVLDTGEAAYITHVLARSSDSARLSAPGIALLEIVQPSLRLACEGDLTLTSAQGSVAITARNFLASVAETMVQNAQHLVTHAQHCVLQAAALLRVHGRQALLTAEQDLKIDAERVTLG